MQELADRNLPFGDEAIALNTKGTQAFGMLRLGGDNGDDWNFVIGWRNAHDKSFACSLAFGSNVLVCDNLSFHGDVVLSRKHTKLVETDLQPMIYRGLGQVLNERQAIEHRFESYRQSPVDDLHAHDLLVRCVSQEVLPSSRVRPALEAWHESTKYGSDKTCWRLYNAVTESIKATTAPSILLGRTLKLQKMIDDLAV